MGTKPENRRYEAKQRAQGFVRGPRITADAAEALRELSFRNRLDPWQVVSVLLLEAQSRSDLTRQADAFEVFKAPEGSAREQRAMRIHGLSISEARDYVRMADGQ